MNAAAGGRPRRSAAPWTSETRGTEVLYLFNGVAANANENIQCPGSHGNHRPRYVKVPFDKLSSYFNVKSGPNVYLSLSQIKRLGAADGSPDADVDEQNGTPAWVDGEADFLDEGCGEWQISRAFDFPTSVRLDNGKVFSGLVIPVEKHHNWQSAIQNLLGDGKSKGHFKPTRQCSLPLDRNLLIKPLSIRSDLVETRFSTSLEDFLQDAINLANNAPKDPESKWNLEFSPKHEETPNHIELSVDPFGFYKTLIHEDDWDKYMNSLAQEDESAIRSFIELAADEPHQVLDNVLTAVGERDITVQSMLTSEELEELRLKPAQHAQDVSDAQAFRRRVNVALKDKRRRGIQSFKKRYNFIDGETEITVGLNVDKMTAATGKRSNQPSQKAVMGNVSGTDIAKILGWEETRLESGFFSSEWLHLSAFSWGGFADAGTPAGYGTSQSLENLVFGTSETNSLMTRYETAWQNFFRFEQDLSDKLNDDLNCSHRDLQGVLEIDCNNPKESIRHDRHNGTKYYIDDMRLDPELVELFKKQADENRRSLDPFLMCTLLNAQPNLRDNDGYRLVQDERPFGKSTTEPQMLALAHDFPFVAYSLIYSIKPQFRSKLLADLNPSASFTFYPFHRSLYHEAEAKLDSILWNKLKEGLRSQLIWANELAIQDEENLRAGRREHLLNERKAKRAEQGYQDRKDMINARNDDNAIPKDNAGNALPLPFSKKKPIFNVFKNHLAGFPLKQA